MAQHQGIIIKGQFNFKSCQVVGLLEINKEDVRSHSMGFLHKKRTKLIKLNQMHCKPHSKYTDKQVSATNNNVHAPTPIKQTTMIMILRNNIVIIIIIIIAIIVLLDTCFLVGMSWSPLATNSNSS